MVFNSVIRNFNSLENKMTSENLPIPLLNWLAAAAIAVGLGASHLLDGPDEIESARLDAQALADAQLAAAQDAARERAAALICAERNAAPRWTAAGELTCTTR